MVSLAVPLPHLTSMALTSVVGLNQQIHSQIYRQQSAHLWRLTRAFGHLSESAREAWRIFGQNNPRVDRLGESRPMSALNAFMSANQNRQTAGFTGQLSEPIVLNFALPGLALNPDNSSFTIDEATNTV